MSRRKLAVIAVIVVCCAVSYAAGRLMAAEEVRGGGNTTTSTPSTGGTTTTGGSSLGVNAQSQEITEAVSLFKDRDFDGALKLLKEAAKKNADLPPAQVIMAQLFSESNIPVGIRSSLEQAVVDAPNDPEAYRILGDMALRERRMVEARMLYQKAGELIGPFNASAKRKELLQPMILSGLAAIDEIQERWADAQKRLEAWLKLEPKNVTALQRLANCLFQQKNPQAAMEELKQAAKADKKVLTPEAILSQLYERAGDRENAKKWMKKALEVAPRDMKTRLVAGQWALETEQIPEAEKQAAEALRLNPKSVDAKILSGVVWLFKKDFARAESYFEAAHLDSPHDFAATNNLALVLAEQKDESKKRRALEYAQNNVQLNPRSAEAAATYGWVLYKNGKLDEAKKAFQVAVSGGTAAPDTAYYIACLSYDQGRESEAKQWLDLALKNTGPFVFRPEAKALLERLKK
jgi:tetratricopeptide (TPR) repeat protein